MKVIRKIIILLFIMFGVWGMSTVYATTPLPDTNKGKEVDVDKLKLQKDYTIRIPRI